MQFTCRPVDQHQLFSLSRIKSIADKLCGIFIYNSANVRRFFVLYIYSYNVLFAYLLRKNFT